jgi:DMSO reductase anchor subunit
MNISIRTSLLFVSTIAVMGAFYSSMLTTAHFDVTESDFRAVFALALLVLMFASFCATGASIAYDKERTRRSAARGALNGFYVWLTFGMLVGLIGMPRVT